MNRRWWWGRVGVVVALASVASFANAADDVATILRRQTRELFDAVTAGDSTVWDRYLASGAVYADEGGELNHKAKLIASIKPLPKDVSGRRRTGRPEETLKAEVADLFYVPGRPRLRKVFQRGADGKILGFVERREAWDISWKRRAP